ncbi:MAG: fatty acid--CoA ligase family protein [Hyphomicrobiaceae bacterium]|nr:fatty acid--CoA ligase family protein [Hyphomicrobiaceae bacterium]
MAASVERENLESIAQIEWHIDPLSGAITRATSQRRRGHPLFEQLVECEHPGLVVFTSGSSGKPKAILHDLERVAMKFATQRKPWRMLLMLLMDHFGGFNTLLACLSDGGTGICVSERSPLHVCQAIERDRAHLLPTTPTFLAMLIGSELWKTHDLSSLELITYGAEPMPSAVLARLRKILPHVQLKQTYGLSELGVLRSSSPEPDSLWIRVGGDGFETKVVDGLLYIRSESNMLGYLNAPSPIDEDGWMNTGDLVETRNGLIRFLGRKNEVINVGGQKVFPTEVENVIVEAEGVSEAVVTSTPHSLLGNAVVAKVALDQHEDPKSAANRLRDHCRQHLQKYKVPMRFEFVELSELMTERAKKRRISQQRPDALIDSRSDV